MLSLKFSWKRKKKRKELKRKGPERTGKSENKKCKKMGLHGGCRAVGERSVAPQWPLFSSPTPSLLPSSISTLNVSILVLSAIPFSPFPSPLTDSPPFPFSTPTR